MESKTYFKNLKITPRKMREATYMIKKKEPMEAVSILSLVNKKSAIILTKVLNSAIMNAKQTLKVGENMLEFKLLTVEEGQKLKRYRASSRGMADSFNRRFCHVKVILGPSSEIKPKGTKKKSIENKASDVKSKDVKEAKKEKTNPEQSVKEKSKVINKK